MILNKNDGDSEEEIKIDYESKIPGDWFLDIVWVGVELEDRSDGEYFVEVEVESEDETLEG